MIRKLMSKLIPITIIAAAIVGVCIFFWYRSHNKVVDVYPVMNIESYTGDSEALRGVVASGHNQTITLKDGTVEKICVKEGDTVKAGDVLMVYDPTSLQLKLEVDEADIAVQEDNIRKMEIQLEKYKNLQPSENAPTYSSTIIDNGPLELKTSLTPEDGASDGEFNCSLSTEITPEFLKALRSSGSQVSLYVYDEETLFGIWLIDGASLPEKKYVYEKVTPTPTVTPEPTATPEPTVTPEPTATPEPTTTPEPTDAPEPTGDGDLTNATALTKTSDSNAAIFGLKLKSRTGSFFGQTSADAGESAGSDAQDEESEDALYKRIKKDPLDTGFHLEDALSFSGDGVTVIMDPYDEDDTACYGIFSSCTPIEYERYTEIEPEPFTPTDDNYVYSRKELDKMISDTEKEISDAKVELKEKQLNLEQDKLTSQTGEVLAAYDGTISAIKDLSGLKTGDEIFTLKGSGGSEITIYIDETAYGNVNIGDIFTCASYVSNLIFQAEVTQKGDEPVTEETGGNPNVSYYPITALAENVDGTLTIGENIQVSGIQSADESSGFMLEECYTRKDDDGTYVLKRGADGKLVKQYVKTGMRYYGMVQILDGLEPGEYIAFPYGTGVSEGSETNITE